MTHAEGMRKYESGATSVDLCTYCGKDFSSVGKVLQTMFTVLEDTVIGLELSPEGHAHFHFDCLSKAVREGDITEHNLTECLYAHLMGER